MRPRILMRSVHWRKAGESNNASDANSIGKEVVACEQFNLDDMIVGVGA